MTEEFVPERSVRAEEVPALVFRDSIVRPVGHEPKMDATLGIASGDVEL